MLTLELISTSQELIPRVASAPHLEINTTPMASYQSSRTELHSPQPLSTRVRTMDLSKRPSLLEGIMLSSRSIGTMMMLRIMPSESTVQNKSQLYSRLTLQSRQKSIRGMLITTMDYKLYKMKNLILIHGIHTDIHGLLAASSIKWLKVQAHMTQLLTRCILRLTVPAQWLLQILVTPALRQGQANHSLSLATANWRRNPPPRLRAPFLLLWRTLQESRSDGMHLFLEK